MISKVTNHFSHSQTCKSIIHHNQILYGDVNPLLVTIYFVHSVVGKLLGTVDSVQSIFKVLTYFVLASFVTDATSKCKMTLHSKIVKPFPNLTSTFAFFFHLCHQMQTLSMNTIICCQRTQTLSVNKAYRRSECEYVFNLTFHFTRYCD